MSLLAISRNSRLRISSGRFGDRHRRALPADWPEPLNGLTIRGRMDRIDLDPVRKIVCGSLITNLNSEASSTAEDKDLYRAGAARRDNCNHPFTSLLGKQVTPAERFTAPAPEVEASFYYIASRWTDGPLVTTSFRSEGFAGKIGEEIQKHDRPPRQRNSDRAVLHPTGRILPALRRRRNLPQEPSAQSLAGGERSAHARRIGSCAKKIRKSYEHPGNNLPNLPMRPNGNAPSGLSITIWSSPREREPARPLCWSIGSSICCCAIPNPLKITEIVALTFTNKAANEMKLRLRDRLQSYLAVRSRP